MMISKETDYALRILRILNTGEKMKIAKICESEDIPLKFGYKIIEKLQKNELVACTRGVNGGCQLNTNLRDVSLYDLLEMMDDHYYVHENLKPGIDVENEIPYQRLNTYESLSILQGDIDAKLKDMDLYGLMFEKAKA